VPLITTAPASAVMVRPHRFAEVVGVIERAARAASLIVGTLPLRASSVPFGDLAASRTSRPACRYCWWPPWSVWFHPGIEPAGHRADDAVNGKRIGRSVCPDPHAARRADEN
jgi:hypothetical protein